MRLTTRGRYAVTAILDLALHQKEGHVTVVEISKRQDIAVSYLGQLFSQLRKEGLVNSQRGPGGGYCLAKMPEDITLSDVIDAVDERLDTTRCGGSADCQNHQQCLTHSLWANLGRKIHNFLADVSLAQAISDHALLKVSKRQDCQFVAAVSINRKPITQYASGSFS